MKYSKSIIGFMFLNLIIVFLTVFVANKSRDIEKQNKLIKNNIVILEEDIHINLIEFTAHKNNNYLNYLFNLYLRDLKNQTDKNPNLIALEELPLNKNIFELVKINN